MYVCLQNLVPISFISIEMKQCFRLLNNFTFCQMYRLSIIKMNNDMNETVMKGQEICYWIGTTLRGICPTQISIFYRLY